MKYNILKLFLLFLIVNFHLSCTKKINDTLSKEFVIKTTQKVATWQINTFNEMGKYRALPTTNRKKWHHRERYRDVVWNCGVLYSGMLEWSKVSNDSSQTKWLLDVGYRNGWRLNNHKSIFHADNHTVALSYIELFKQKKDSAIIKPLIKSFDKIIETSEENKSYWTWCDALFMSPPVWAALSDLTGDPKYLEYMDMQYRMAYQRLWNHEDQLFFRDKKRIKVREKNGAHEYWARGNGWVYGGLTYMIPYLPEDWENRSFYINLFKEMSSALKKTQRSDGTWSMGIMGNEEDYPIKEISGSNFFVFGLSKGVQWGILDKNTYNNTIVEGWKAISECVREDGLVGYVQGVGAAPGESFENYTEIYGSGGFLAAGAAMHNYLTQ